LNTTSLARGLAAVDRVRNAALVGVLAAMVLVYTASFLSRYVPAVGSLNWAEELTRFLHVWAVFLAYGHLVRRRGHIATDVLSSRLPLGGRRVLRALGESMLASLSIVFVWYGTQMVILNADQQAPSLGMAGIDALQGWPTSMAWPYLAIPLAGALALLDQFHTLREPQDSAGHAPLRDV
jgi:TRAP-type C4-dicarboxylate transport system permease small subunit